MPKGKKAGGRDFKKGNPGGPGKPKLPPEIKELRIKTRSEVEQMVAKYWGMSPAELQKALVDPKTIAAEQLVIRVITRGIAKGDANTMNFLSDYLFGARPKEIKVDNRSSDGSMTPQISFTQISKDPEVFDLLTKLDEKLSSRDPK